MKLGKSTSPKFKLSLERYKQSREPHDMKSLSSFFSAFQSQHGLFPSPHELEYFINIPITCTHLRKQLLSNKEKSADEWTKIRNICIKHVKLQSNLIECTMTFNDIYSTCQSENTFDSQKKNIESLLESYQKLRVSAAQRKTDHRKSVTICDVFQAVETIISYRIDDVWSLGRDMSERILGGVGLLLKPSVDDRERLLVLTEAISFYERAADQYKVICGVRQTLYFTDIKTLAISRICNSFNETVMDIFQDYHEKTIKYSNKRGVATPQLILILETTTIVIPRIDFIKNETCSCFPVHWKMENILTSCMFQIFSSQIIPTIFLLKQNILSLSETLKLVALMEVFLDHFSRRDISSNNKLSESMFKRFESFTSLVSEIESADYLVNDHTKTNKNLSWGYNILFEVHRIGKEEILTETMKKIDLWLENIYTSANHTFHQKSNGVLTSSFRNDIYFLITTHLRTLQDHLPMGSETLIVAFCIIFSHLHDKQVNYRYRFLRDFKSCCSAANDFLQLSEMCQTVTNDVVRGGGEGERGHGEYDDDNGEGVCGHKKNNNNDDERRRRQRVVMNFMTNSSKLRSLFKRDAVYAAQMTHVYIFKSLCHTSGDGGCCRSMAARRDDDDGYIFFSDKWEDKEEPGGQNDPAEVLVRTLEDFIGDLKIFLTPYLMTKAVEAIVSATCVFYVKCLLTKVSPHPRYCRMMREGAHFKNIGKALDRTMSDIELFRAFFDNIVMNDDGPQDGDNNQNSNMLSGGGVIGDTIEREFEFLFILHEIMNIAAGLSSSDISDFILLVHKKLTDVNVTKYFFKNVWNLINPKEELFVSRLLEIAESDMNDFDYLRHSLCSSSSSSPSCVSLNHHWFDHLFDRSTVPGLRIDEMIAELYFKNNGRKLARTNKPLKGVVCAMEKRCSSLAICLKGIGR